MGSPLGGIVRDCTKLRVLRHTLNQIKRRAKLFQFDIPRAQFMFVRARNGHTVPVQSPKSRRKATPIAGSAARGSTLQPCWPSALSSSSQMLRSRRRRLTAPASAPPRSATPAWSARTTSSARSRRDSFSHPAAPAQNRTETNQHRVSCSMVDKMDVQDSAQRITSPRSQHTASSTGDSLQLSMRSAMRAVCPTFSDDRSLASHHACGRLCLR